MIDFIFRYLDLYLKLKKDPIERDLNGYIAVISSFEGAALMTSSQFKITKKKKIGKREMFFFIINTVRVDIFE